MSSPIDILDVDAVIEKLTLGIGEERARQVVRESMAESRLRTITNADELQKLGERLVARGGFICIVGRSLLVEAIMLRRRTRG